MFPELIRVGLLPKPSLHKYLQTYDLIYIISMLWNNYDT